MGEPIFDYVHRSNGRVNPIAPPARNYVQDQAGQLLDSLFSFVNLKTTQLTLKIDLTPVKNNFQGQTGIDAINRLIDSLPALYSSSRLISFIQSISQLTTGDFSYLQLCKPPQLYLSIFTPFFTSIGSAKSASRIPMEIGHDSDWMPRPVVAKQNWYGDYKSGGRHGYSRSQASLRLAWKVGAGKELLK